MSAAVSAERPTVPRLVAWRAAIRPKTLTAAFCPVLVGSALAFAEGRGRLAVALVTLLAAICIQIGTNLFNDVADFRRGADGDDRLGPPRVTQLGWCTPGAVMRASLLALAAAFGLGVYLVALGGWPILVVGLASLLCAVAYTAGPSPLAYNGLADLFVLVFFGVLAVGGTYYLQVGAISAGAVWCGLAVGLPALGLLAINNVRDCHGDARAGKRTLVVRFGEAFGRREYVVALLAPYALVVAAVLLGHGDWGWLVVLASLPLALGLLRAARNSDGRALNGILGRTARFQLALSALLSAGISLPW